MNRYIVLRPAPGTPDGWMFRRADDGWWLSWPDTADRYVYHGHEARPTGRYEYADAGEHAEVYEVGPPDIDGTAAAGVLEIHEVIPAALWEQRGPWVRERLAAGLEITAHRSGVHLARQPAWSTSTDPALLAEHRSFPPLPDDPPEVCVTASAPTTTRPDTCRSPACPERPVWAVG